MSTDALASGTAPFVVLKPRGQRVGSSIYSIRGGMFEPDRTSVAGVVNFLNEFTPGAPTNVGSVDSVYPKECPPVKTGRVSLMSAEMCAWLGGHSILGGVFMEYLHGYGVASYYTTVARVAAGDRRFFETVYPDFIGFFDTPRKNVNVDFLEGVQRNTVGTHRILLVAAHNSAASLDVVTRQIAYLKRVYRLAVRKYVSFQGGCVRDNLVHSPENATELAVQGPLYAQRII